MDAVHADNECHLRVATVSPDCVTFARQTVVVKFAGTSNTLRFVFVATV